MQRMRRLVLMLGVAFVVSAEAPNGARWKSEQGLTFVFSVDTGNWVGEKLVTNAQFRSFDSEHPTNSLAPVRGILRDQIIAYAGWLAQSEVARGALIEGANFRLPLATELPSGASEESLLTDEAGTAAEQESRGFRLVLVEAEAQPAGYAGPFPAMAVGCGLLGLGLLAIAAVGTRRRRAFVPEANEEARTPKIGSLADDALGYDLVITPDGSRDAMALVNSPAEVDTRNSSIVTSILDLRKRAGQERKAPAAAPPKLPKVKPLPKTKLGPLNEESWDQLMPATASVPKVELPAGASPKVIEDETRDDFELPRHTNVKRKKSPANSVNALDDNTLNTLIKGDDSFDIDDFVNSVD